MMYEMYPHLTLSRINTHWQMIIHFNNTDMWLILKTEVLCCNDLFWLLWEQKVSLERNASCWKPWGDKDMQPKHHYLCDKVPLKPRILVCLLFAGMRIWPLLAIPNTVIRKSPIVWVRVKPSVCGVINLPTERDKQFCENVCGAIPIAS